MKILAIDPGSTESAFVIFDGINILDKGIIPNEQLLDYSASYDKLAIEMVASYGMPVGKTVFETCVWIGRFIEAHGLGITADHDKVYRQEVKMHLCNSMRAKDGNIRQALIDRFGEVGTKKNPGALYGVSSDIWSALAVAVYEYDKLVK